MNNVIHMNQFEHLNFKWPNTHEPEYTNNNTLFYTK